ncbi:MAG: signal peptide peptidase SppA [Acidaminococcales bacterium]|jgi:protease-4|nr:signal peptide peptidase SppA [Acidaminococcales bacterium]
MRKLLMLIGFVSLISFLAKPFFSEGTAAENGKYIAVIRIQGTLYGTAADSITGRLGGAEEIMRQIIEAGKDPSVAAVLFRIDSPGGSVTAAEEIAREISKLKGRGKPIVTSMGDIAASAGYWLASCSDYIVANSSTLTGSIGVYIPYTNFEELYKKIGISSERVKSGRHKDMLAPERPMTDEERRMLQAMVDEMYAGFVRQISEGRGLPEDEVRALADGRIYTGHQAKELRLVDEIGNYYDALAIAAQRAGLEGEPRVKTYDRPISWRDILQLGLLREAAFFMRDLAYEFMAAKGAES